MTDPGLFDRALGVLLDHDTSTTHDPPRRVMVPADRVLAWNYRGDAHVRHLAGLIESGIKLPPVELHERLFGGESWYSVQDGCHRTLAYRLLGRDAVPALIWSRTEVAGPAHFYLCSDGARRLVDRRKIEDEPTRVIHGSRWLPADLAGELVRLGVEVMR